MDDLEFNGTFPSENLPVSEPSTPEVPQQTVFYAWSGSNPEPVKTTTPWGDDISVNEKPKEEPKKAPKAAKKPVFLMISMLTGVALLVLLTFLVSNRKMNNLQKQYTEQINGLTQQLVQLENRLTMNQTPSTPTRPQHNTNATNDMPTVSGDLMTPAQVYAQCAPSVVAINCTGVAYGNFGQTAKTSSSGSGFVLSSDGYIVTNYHVVDGSTTIEACMYDGSSYPATYIGGDEANDIALIKVEAENLPFVTIGSSSDLIVGDQVVAIGNPLGELAATLTVGYVSAKDRMVTGEGTQINMLQTDAAINPGNSGGPLFNMYGEVIGITSAKYSGTTSSGATIEGIGFAIPTDDVMMMLEDLKNFGYITGGYLGVTITEVSEEATTYYGLPQGILIREVMPGSCAETGGIKPQDIIINLGGNEIKNLNDLSRALNKFKGGQEVIVTVYRNGREVDLTVVLDERPQEEATTPETTAPTTQPYDPWGDYGYGYGDDFMEDWFGQFFG
jgi:serine protease Do